VALSLASILAAQTGRKKSEKGPRALGLVELSSDGSARLIPIAIMVDGKFYDAAAYKASPIPLALWGQTVYEGEKTGVSQGLFTVGEAMRVGNNNWFGEGKWRPTGSEPKPRKTASAKPRMEEEEGPPKLRRPEAEKSGTPAPTGDKSEAPPAAKPDSAPAPATTTQDDKKPSSPGHGNPPIASPNVAPKGEDSADETSPQKPDQVTSVNDEDPNRPVLKRGKRETEAVVRPGASTGVPRRPSGAAATAETKQATPQQIPAISDAGGPEPRPYAYDIKPDEEQKYRKAMLALAADAVRAHAKEVTPAVAPAKPATRASARTAAKTPQPTFDDVQFRAFDLWNTNEPVFVLSAIAHMPGNSSTSPGASDPLYVTLVAKRNIYDELHKLYAGVTDSRHLDQTPRLELIDAVDADGDGRGELLFRRITDTGKAYGVYRAAADQLFPLFEGTPNGQ
jgi:hypothetical protein